MSIDLTPVYPIVTSAELPGGIDLSGESSLYIPMGTIVQPSAKDSVGSLMVGATEVSQGFGNDVFRVSSSGIHLGAADFADAPFSVDMQGNLTATSGTFTGDITGASGTFSGAIQATSIDIPDTTTANSFHVDGDGNAWWGATTLAGSTAKVLNTGVATFSDVNINGGVFVSTDITEAETRLNTLFVRFVFVGNINDGLTETPGAGGTITRGLMTTYMDSATGVNCSITSADFSTTDASVEWDQD